MKKSKKEYLIEKAVEKFAKQYRRTLLGLSHADKGKKIECCRCCYCSPEIDELEDWTNEEA